MLKRSICFWLSVVWKLSILQSGLLRWKQRHENLSETFDFVLMGLETLRICNKLISCLESYRLRLTHWVRINCLASVPTIGLQTFKDLRNWLLWTKALRVSTIDDHPSISPRTLESKSLSVSGYGKTFALVELCGQKLVRLGNVRPNLSISKTLLLRKTTTFCIASNVGTTSP